MVKSQDERCSFCGKSKTANNPLIASNPKVSGRQAFICRACTQFLYQDYFDVDEEVADGVDLKNIPSPGALKRHLDDYVVGQERAKKVFSVAVYNHYKRILSRGAFGLDGDRGNMLPPNYMGLVDDVELSKSNILLIGPTGSGKTLMAQTLARYLNIPIAISDATSLTEAGYVGEDVENILTRLYQAADYNVRRSEIGIVFIDEIDKISRLSENRSITRDVSGEGVQQALLKIIEGSTVNIPPRGGRKHPNQDFVQIDTSNILFICGGAFDGIEDIIKRKLGNNVLGFRSNDQVGDMSKKECILDHVDTEDLVSYGLIPELVGRLHVLTTLEPITKETMMYIMTEPKNAILKQYRKLFEFDEVSLEFDNEAIERIAELALAKKTGARGLRGIIEQFCIDLMFDLPNLKGYKVIITKACVDRLEEPILIKSNKKVI